MVARDQAKPNALIAAESTAPQAISEPSADRPIRFPIDGLQVWARTRSHAEEILRAAKEVR